MIFNKKKFTHFYGPLLSATLFFAHGAHAQKEAEAIVPDTVVNSRFNEIKPVFSPDGQQLYFTRSNHPLNSGGRRDKGDVWQAKVKAPGEWAAVKKLGGAINSSQVNMVIGFSADGKDLYFQTYNPETKGKRQSGIFKMPVGGGKAEPVTIHYFFNGAKYQDASISPDGKVMLLALESYSTYGLEDLYVSFLQQDGSWSEPKNLGLDINTPKQEMSAWLAADGQTLYFASNGRGGSGSMDIFRSRRLDGSWKRWSKPENLGPQVNSAGADLYYAEAPDRKWAYYSSTQNSEGFGDIKKIRIPEQEDSLPVLAEETPMEEVIEPFVAEKIVAAAEDSIEEVTVLVKQSFDLEGEVRAQNGSRLPAKIQLSSVEGDFSQETSTSGTFKVSLPEAGAYLVKAQTQGFFPVDTVVQVNEGLQTLRLNLKPITVGETVRLDNVMFRQSTAFLLEESNAALDEVVELMQENPEMEILLTGHTDNQGSSKANIKLSRDRVEAVKNYLISRGIEEERIEGKGYGPTRPIASNASEETRKLNRRVEFIIIKK
ncbi:OmpA family protein [Nafulsella turpanensis]|uniref:OmpA family protein n=1 Tax=Nafulsella turpanensis TaxID=1265690 RepID=UPI00034D7C0B|nr:OmpA family protein [Nafulsella turpanensis]